jgi:hypothetical protein
MSACQDEDLGRGLVRVLIPNLNYDLNQKNSKNKRERDHSSHTKRYPMNLRCIDLAARVVGQSIGLF